MFVVVLLLLSIDMINWSNLMKIEWVWVINIYKYQVSKLNRKIGRSEYLAPRTAHLGPLYLYFFPSHWQLYLYILVVSSIVHLASDVLMFAIGLCWLVAELELLVKMSLILVLWVFFESGPQDYLAGVLVLLRLKVRFLWGISQHFS